MEVDDIGLLAFGIKGCWDFWKSVLAWLGKQLIVFSIFPSGLDVLGKVVAFICSFLCCRQSCAHWFHLLLSSHEWVWGLVVSTPVSPLWGYLKIYTGGWLTVHEWLNKYPFGEIFFFLSWNITSVRFIKINFRFNSMSTDPVTTVLLCQH